MDVTRSASSVRHDGTVAWDRPAGTHRNIRPPSAGVPLGRDSRLALGHRQPRAARN
ncbi:uncharacterized protein B0H18DRAFT_1031477 [Fomitopsis serialis]|uniref:uncharacterized protein n=1 Tax=Fomitopsis serialis TaxID=139415 RepID=UPI0020076225|nr:uncharacterized protein B0H18DRAFT_1031477 [Neoantrodia serialis]KAH9918302.1 hypothetical protein B0H18DRAFT_1031477 [Neoantrodia serialis]